MGSGNLDMISLLLAHGARPFLSTLMRDTLCYSSSAQKGCYRYKKSFFSIREAKIIN